MTAIRGINTPNGQLRFTGGIALRTNVPLVWRHVRQNEWLRPSEIYGDIYAGGRVGRRQDGNGSIGFKPQPVRRVAKLVGQPRLGVSLGCVSGRTGVIVHRSATDEFSQLTQRTIFPYLRGLVLFFLLRSLRHWFRSLVLFVHKFPPRVISQRV